VPYPSTLGFNRSFAVRWFWDVVAVSTLFHGFLCFFVSRLSSRPRHLARSSGRRADFPLHLRLLAWASRLGESLASLTKSLTYFWPAGRRRSVVSFTTVVTLILPLVWSRLALYDLPPYFVARREFTYFGASHGYDSQSPAQTVRARRLHHDASVEYGHGLLGTCMIVPPTVSYRNLHGVGTSSTFPNKSHDDESHVWPLRLDVCCSFSFQYF